MPGKHELPSGWPYDRGKIPEPPPRKPKRRKRTVVVTAALLTGVLAAGLEHGKVTALYEQISNGSSTSQQQPDSSHTNSDQFYGVLPDQASPTPSASTTQPTAPEISDTPPPRNGYFQLVPVDQFNALPNDTQAAAMVHKSSWEPRPENYTANHTVPPANFHVNGYSGMKHAATIYGRVTGNFTGTTDEIIQWTAAKWGLPDNVIRAEAVQESQGYQDDKDSSGKPISGKGYGDFGKCSTGTPQYGQSGPDSFGIEQVKWCTITDNKSDPASGGYPWTEKSTAFGLDMYAATIRGCFQGDDTWLGNGYKAGDLWGCVGRWFSGEWKSNKALGYINKVKKHLAKKEWLSWPDKSSSIPQP